MLLGKVALLPQQISMFFTLLTKKWNCCGSVLRGIKWCSDSGELSGTTGHFVPWGSQHEDVGAFGLPKLLFLVCVNTYVLGINCPNIPGGFVS